ncbi:MAG TPA: ABC transporter ATP-binding protein [Planctomycetota bacterium]|nr:ABC transporter ATP-binding protein [Planctomycetota bacterium]
MDQEWDAKPVMEVRGLELAYRAGPKALDGFSFSLPPGCHGLLGPNGAGKSTLLKVLLGLLLPDQGDGSVLGRDIRKERTEVRRRVGYMPERDAHVPGILALDYVSLMGELSGLGRNAATRRSHEVLHYVDLGEARYRAIDGFSAGMRQRLKLAAALVHDPDLLLLDEPTNGLDPKGRRNMLDLVTQLDRSGVSILLCTHLLPDVQEVCSRVVVAARGKVTRTGTVKELTKGLDRSFRVQVVGEAPLYVAHLQNQNIEASYDPTQGLISVLLPEGFTTRCLVEAAAATRCGLKKLLPGTRSLEDVFLESIQEAPRAHP